MKFSSTRGGSPDLGFSAALLQGLAPDGGLYVPQSWPDLSSVQPGALPEVAAKLIGAFAQGDALAPQIPAITRDAFDFPAPVRRLDAGASAPSEPLRVLELFHGPTAAFKDFGARFLGATLQRLQATALTAAAPPRSRWEPWLTHAAAAATASAVTWAVAVTLWTR